MVLQWNSRKLLLGQGYCAQLTMHRHKNAGKAMLDTGVMLWR